MNDLITSVSGVGGGEFAHVKRRRRNKGARNDQKEKEEAD